MKWLAGDLDGVPLLFRLVGEEAQDCEKASVVVAVAAEGEGCILSCWSGEAVSGVNGATFLVGVLGATVGMEEPFS